ncbi:hydrogen peroxide-inducible genes activator [Alkalilacustris brevis]|uniref:hydrogen peroxide-inducible genes activator n=1 Tax=Alkalilacustris brevis TaxID=2026338 RepID=UPI000E0D5410|nr:hydrogen peroxide-inducible genes activator [Alkalilacustris brevis]
MLTLRQLRFLVALADELNFTRAAERCHVTQSTLSAGVQALEEQLELRLVERSRRSVMMTEIGAEIAERGRALLLAAQEIEEIAAAQLRPDEGDLRLGSISTAGPFLLPPALPRIREAYPHLRVYLREELTESLLEGVANGRLDLALIALPFDIGGLACMKLFTDGYHLAAPRGHCGTLTDDGEQLLLLEKGHCLQRHALSAFPERRLEQDESFAATSLTTLVSMVSEGLGITLLPNLAVAAGMAAQHDITLAPLPGAHPREVVLVWRKTSPRTAVFEGIGNALIQTHVAMTRPPRPNPSEHESRNLT